MTIPEPVRPTTDSDAHQRFADFIRNFAIETARERARVALAYQHPLPTPRQPTEDADR